MKYILEVVKSVEESGLLIEDVSETIQEEAKEHTRSFFFRMLLGLLATNLVANLVPSKAKIPGRAAILAGKGTITLTNL